MKPTATPRQGCLQICFFADCDVRIHTIEYRGLR